MTKETFINSFGEKMTREIPNDPPNTTITLEEIQLLKDALQDQFDSNYEMDEEMLKDHINGGDWGSACGICFRLQQAQDAFELLKKLKERTNKNGMEKKDKNSRGTNGV